MSLSYTFNVRFDKIYDIIIIVLYMNLYGHQHCASILEPVIYVQLVLMVLVSHT